MVFLYFQPITHLHYTFGKISLQHFLNDVQTPTLVCCLLKDSRLGTSPKQFFQYWHRTLTCHPRALKLLRFQFQSFSKDCISKIIVNSSGTGSDKGDVYRSSDCFCQPNFFVPFRSPATDFPSGKEGTIFDVARK